MASDRDERHGAQPSTESGRVFVKASDDGGQGSDPEATLTMGRAANDGWQRPEVTGQVGGYRLVSLLGEGGMGVVYEAEQRSPHRRVALKVMRRSHLVDELHTRLFHLEAQTLARLRHPKIAAIYESGHTEDGHDFFAMELVRGVTLHRWLEDRPPLTTPGELGLRLRLFRSICEPVQYAHQRGVIHRDLKPANIMVSDDADQPVSITDAAPAIKILDFGLARITDPELEAVSVMTEVGSLRGTLAYMSPEQTRNELDAVDVRTDVYALGMILYEMLSGTRAYDLSSTSLVNAVRIICEEPPRPLRLGSPAAGCLDRDLETIVGKALEKEPDRRYGTVAALTDDVERYLSARPIRARRPSAAYRLQKFAQRHRAGVAAAAVALVAVIAGMIGIGTGLVRARAAEADARREAATSAVVSSFLADMLASVDAQQVGRLLFEDLEERVESAATARGVDPGEAVALFREATREVSGTGVGLRVLDTAILGRAGSTLRERFADEPAVAGSLEHTLAQTYDRLGLYDTAMEHARRAAELLRRSGGGDDREALRSDALIGLLSFRLGRIEEAERLLRVAWERLRSAYGKDDPDALSTQVRLSWVLIEQDRLAEAEALLQQAVAGQRLVLGAEHRETITTMNRLAVVLADQQRYADAEALHSEVLSLRSRLLGPTDPDTLKSLTNLAVVAFYQGRLETATDLFREVLEIQTGSLGPEHPVTLASTNNLAVVLERQGRLDEAEALQRRALNAKRAVLGPDHPETLSSEYNLAVLYTAQGRLDDAEAMHGRVLEVRRRTLGPRHPGALDVLCALAGIDALRGDRASALARLDEAVGLGYADGDTLEADGDFASIRDDPGFLAVVERARRNAAAGG